MVTTMWLTLRLFLTLPLLLWPLTASQAQETVAYRLHIEAAWTAESHPLDFPEHPTFSRMIGATHDLDYAMFRDGDTASSGLELIAERGRPSIFRIELEEARDRNLIGTVFEGGEIEDIPGKTTLSFEAIAAFPHVSFVTMIAPSPDWITGVSGVLLYRDNAWIDRVEIPLWAWDVGTDSGDSYAAFNQDTQPQQSIRLVSTPHFLNDRGLLGVGRVVIERVKKDR